MKKFKLGTFLAMLIILGSCSEEKVDQTEAIQNEVVEEVGLVNGGIVYPPADKYSSKFTYFHNGVKLTDKKMIEGMLQNAIHFSANELNIEIALNENEKQAIEAKYDQEDSEVKNNAQKAAPRRGRVYHNLWQPGKTPILGSDNLRYPANFNPTVMRFANLSNQKARVECVYVYTLTTPHRLLSLYLTLPKKTKIEQPAGFASRHTMHFVKYFPAASKQ